MSFNKPVRTFKANPEANAGIKFMDESVTLTGADEDIWISIGEEAIGISGNINLQGMSNQIKMGGLMMFQLTPLMMVPSTLTTPFPGVLPNIELIGRIVEVVATAASMLTLLG